MEHVGWVERSETHPTGPRDLQRGQATSATPNPLSIQTGYHLLMTNQDRRGASYHEAGHAVVASALGLLVGQIHIAPGGDDAAGNIEVECSKDLPLIDRLAVCLAGVNAQMMFDAPTHSRSGGGDHAKVIMLVAGLDDDTSSTMRTAGHQRAWDLLHIHRSKVSSLAEYLIMHGAIDRYTVRQMLA